MGDIGGEPGKLGGGIGLVERGDRLGVGQALLLL